MATKQMTIEGMTCLHCERTMPDGEAIAYVLEQTLAGPAAVPRASRVSRPANSLTRRELEIAHLSPRC